MIRDHCFTHLLFLIGCEYCDLAVGHIGPLHELLSPLHYGYPGLRETDLTKSGTLSEGANLR